LNQTKAAHERGSGLGTRFC